MSNFISLKDLVNDIKGFIQSFCGCTVESVNEKKIAIYQPPPESPFDYRTNCHISIFETNLLFPNGSNRTVFIVSLDNCSCLGNSPRITCHTIGTNGLVVETILGDRGICRSRVIIEINNAIIKALDILRYFKGDNWNCHNC